MPSIRGRLDKGRAIISVGVQPTAMATDSVGPMPTFASPPILELRGLVDTGAQVTCITKKAALEVGLKSRGKKLIGNVNSIEYHDAYSFVVGIWYKEDCGDTLNQTTGYFAFDPVYGAGFKDNDDFDLLIGMDIIRQGDFSTKRNGDFFWEL